MRKLENPVTAEVLAKLVLVMATLSPSGVKLVELCATRENADPLLVACALGTSANEAEKLFGMEWLVASDDRAVRAKAVEFGVGILSRDELLGALLGTDLSWRPTPRRWRRR